MSATHGSRPNPSGPRDNDGGRGSRGGIWRMFSAPYSCLNDMNGFDEVDKKGDGTKGREGRKGKEWIIDGAV